MMDKRIKRSRELAIENHGHQMYSCGEPYVYHLDAVVRILKPYGVDAQIIGYLHDVVEDTDVSLQEIEEEFGRFISTCVDILTDEPGRTRKERKEPTYKKVTFFTANEEKYNIVLIVKAADRLANLETSRKNKMYKKEHEKFKSIYYKPGLCEDIWEKIDKIIRI